MASESTKVILIMSGKGGVGKTTISTELAKGLVRRGHSVGIIDGDICGPNVHDAMGVNINLPIVQSQKGWTPIKVRIEDSEKSLLYIGVPALLKNKTEAIIWKGPKKALLLDSFINKVDWGDIDYLIVDTPPGFGSEHKYLLDIIEKCRVYGIVITTSQWISVSDVIRALSKYQENGLEILGVVENMSGLQCDTCKATDNIFSIGGGENLAQKYNLEYIGRLRHGSFKDNEEFTKLITRVENAN